MLPNELWALIVEHCDWESLINLKQCSYLLYEICKKSENKRLYDVIPFSDPNSLLKIHTEDIIIKSITVVLNNKEYSLPHYKFPYVNEILHRWFLFSFFHDDWILTGKIIKSIIRLHNKVHDNRPCDILYFGFTHSGESYLKNIL